MLADLNTILHNTINIKQEFCCYKAAALTCNVNPGNMDCFLMAAFSRVSVKALYQLTGFSEHHFFSLWNFWARMEGRYYGEPPVSLAELNSWRALLRTYEKQIAAIEACATGQSTAAMPENITLREMDGLLQLIVDLVLGMLNPVLQTNFVQADTASAGFPILGHTN